MNDGVVSCRYGFQASWRIPPGCVGLEFSLPSLSLTSPSSDSSLTGVPSSASSS